MKAKKLLSIFLTLLAGSSPLSAEVWNQLGGGTFSWQTSTNWNPQSVPNGINAIANFGVNLTGTTTVTLASAVQVDILTIGDTGGTTTDGNLFNLTIGTNGGPGITFGNTDVAPALLTKAGNSTDTIAAPFTTIDNVTAAINAGTLIFSGDFNIVGTAGGAIEVFARTGGATMTVTGNTRLEDSSRYTQSAGTTNFNGTVSRYSGRVTLTGGTLNFGGANKLFNAVDGIEISGGTMQFGSSTVATRTVITTALTQTGGTVNFGVSGAASTVNIFANVLNKGNGTLQLQAGTGGGTTNILGGSPISKTASTVTNSSTSVSMADTSSLFVGMRVYGAGIQNGTIIQSINPNTSITLSLAADLTGSTVPLIFAEGIQNRSATTSSGSATITVPNTDGLAVGQTVTGAGIPPGAKIIAIGAGTITIDTTAIATGASTIASYAPSTMTLGGTTSITTNFFSGPGATTQSNGTLNFDPSINLVLMDRAFVNFTDNIGTIQHSTFNSITNTGGTFTLTTQAATPTTAFIGAKTEAGSNYVWVSTTTGLAVGTTVTGPGIPAGARIHAIINGYLVLDVPATATSNGVSLTFNTYGTLRSQLGSSTITTGNYSGVNDLFEGRLDFGGSAAGSMLIKVGSNILTLGGWEDNSTARLDVREGTVILAKNSAPGVHAIGSTMVIGDGDAAVETVILGGTHLFPFNPGLKPYLSAFTNYNDQIFRGSDLTVNGNGVLDLNGFSEGFNALTGAGTVTNSAVGTISTLILGENNSGATVNTSIEDGAGQVALIKAGTGGMIFTTDKTYTGSTLITRGSLTLRDNGELSGTSVARVVNGTLFLDNSAINRTDAVLGGGRLNDTVDVYLQNGTLTVINNNNVANNTLEIIGDLIVDPGHSILRIQHSNAVANTVRIHLNSYSRVGGSQISIVENNATGGFGTSTTPNTALSQVTVENMPTAFLIGANGTNGANGVAGTANVSLLLGAFGGNVSNSTAEFMTVQTISGINYIRPLNNGGTEYATLTSGTVTSQVGRMTGTTTLTSNTGYNSLRASGGGGTGPAAILTIGENKALKLGGNTDAAFGAITEGAGMLNLLSNGFTIRGGELDFGIREAIIRGNAHALIQSSITGTNAVNGLLKSGGAQLDLLGNNTYSGETVVAQGNLRVFHNNALGLTGAGNGTKLFGTGFNGDTMLLGLGVTIGDLFDPLKREDLHLTVDTRFGALDQNNVWNGNVIIDAFSEAGLNGNVFLRTREDTAILTINGDVTGGGNSPFPSFNGASGRLLVFAGDNLREGTININGAMSDQNYGSAILGDHEKLNLLVRGSTDALRSANEFHVNIQDASMVHGQFDIQNGFVRLHGDYGTAPQFGQTGSLIMRVRSSGSDQANQLSVLLMTNPGSVYNVSNIVWADNNAGYSVTSYGMIGAEITNGVVTIGNGTGSLDMTPAADQVPGQSFGSTGGTVVGGTNVIDLGAFDPGFDVTKLRPGMLLTGVVPGITFTANSYILQIDTVNNRIVLNNVIGATTNGTLNITSLTFNDATTSTTTNQQYADARLYAMEGGELNIRARLLDDGGFSLTNEVGAVTKVGRGVVRLSGATNLNGELDGGVNLHGGTLILDYTENFGRKITSGTNQQAPLTLAGGDLYMRGASGADITTADDTSIEELRGIMIIRAGESLIRVQSGGVGNITALNLGPPSNLFQGGGMLPVRYAGGTVAFWRDTSLGGSSVITLELPDVYTGAVILPWAVYANNVTGKIMDFAYGRSPNQPTDPIEVAGASSDGGIFALENSGQFFNDPIYNPARGYYAETAEIISGEGSGFFGTVNLGVTHKLRALLFNIDNNNTNGTDYANNVGGRLTNDDQNNMLKFADGTTIVLESDTTGAGFLGGAILIANTVGDTNKTLRGGAISSGLETFYFDPNVANTLVKSHDLIVHNYAEAPGAGGGIFTIQSDIVDNPLTTGVALNFVHSGTGWTKMYRASNGVDDDKGLGQGYGYTGSTFFNGGTIWVSDPNKLGATPGSYDEDNFYFTGGRLRIADMYDSVLVGTVYQDVLVDAVDTSIVLDANRGITIGGDGAIFDIDSENTTFTINSRILVEVHSPTFAGGVIRESNLGIGDIFKEGLGTMVIANQTNTFSGLLQVKEGTVVAQINTNPTPLGGGATDESTLLQNQGVLGSSYTYIDGTYVDAGAALRFEITGGFNNGTADWITLDGGTLGTTAGHVDGSLQGNIRVRQNSTIDIVGSGILRFNSDAGFLTGPGNLTKTGSGTLHLFENSPEFTGNWIVKGGRVEGISQGTPFGTGATIELGDNTSLTPTATAEVYQSSRITSLVNLKGTTTSGTTTIRLTEGDTSGLFVGMPVTGPGIPANSFITSVVGWAGAPPFFQFTISQNATATATVDMVATLNAVVDLPLNYMVTQDIVVNAEAVGAPEQVKRIGAINHDGYLNSGQSNDRYIYDGTITLNDDLLLSYQDSTANTGIGALGVDMYIALNKSISGAAGNDLRTEIIYNGNTAGNSHNDVRVTFELNGDNSAWLGDLTMGNAAVDPDMTHIVRLGHNNALTVNNDVHLNFNNSLQIGGNNVTIGNLFVDVTGVAVGTGANPVVSHLVVENASNTEGTITITQTVDEILDVLFQNGVTPGVYSALTPAVPNNKLNIVKAGSATVTLTQTNTYTGSTTIVEGAIRNGTNDVITNTSPLIINATGAGVTATYDLNSFNESVFSLTMGGTTTTSTPQVTLGTGTLTLLGNVTYDATNNPLGGTIGGSSGFLALGASTRTFTIGDSTSAPVDLTVSARVTGAVGVIKAGAGTMEFSNGTNSYTGATTINGGVLSVNTLANGGLASGIGASAGTSGNLVLNGGTLRYTGAATSTDRLFTLGTSGGGIDASGTGALAFSSGTMATSGTGVRTLTLTGTNTDANRINAVIANDASANATSVSKTGTGTWILAANNNYTGTTTVTEGRLQVGVGGTATGRAVGDTGAGGAGQGATTVSAGAFIGGTGTIRGQASTTSHVVQGTIQPGDYTGTASGVGKLDVVGNLNAADGTISLQISGNSMNDATLGGLQAGSGAYDTQLSSQLATYEASVTGTTGGAAHDFLNISGQLSVDGDSRIQVVTEGSYTYAAGDIFDVLDWLGVALGGGFELGLTNNVGNARLRDGGLDGDLELPTLNAGLVWDVQKLMSDGILIVANGVVPEPGRALLLMAGLAGVIMRRRRSVRK